VFRVLQFFTLSSDALRELLARVFGSVLEKTFAVAMRLVAQFGQKTVALERILY
jgi:hypothetical protein